MNVWWCEVHRSTGTVTGCDGLEIVRFFHEPESPCRMVEKQLVSVDEVCHKCHGSGRVYPAELVERVAKALYEQFYNELDALKWHQLDPLFQDRMRAKAVAVLDALNGETP